MDRDTCIEKRTPTATDPRVSAPPGFPQLCHNRCAKSGLLKKRPNNSLIRARLTNGREGADNITSCGEGHCVMVSFGDEREDVKNRGVLWAALFRKLNVH